MSGPSSASSASHSALSFANGTRQPGSTPDPASAISSVYSHEGDKDPTQHVLPDLTKLSLEKGREVDVEDLDDEGWMAASKGGRIEELGTLGEGAGGAVTKCKLKGGKTVFALKVILPSIPSTPTDLPARLSRLTPTPRCRNRYEESSTSTAK